MREVRVESLEGVETGGADGAVRLLARDTLGEPLTLVFPRPLWESATGGASSQDPTPAELEELEALRDGLKGLARKTGATAVEDVPLGGQIDDGSEERFDLVLRSAGPFAVTTGYVFLPVVRAEQVARIGARLDGDGFVEGAYLVGAVAEEEALAAESVAGEGLKVLSVRGRRCSASHFELAPELWRQLSEGLGWKSVEPVMPSGVQYTTKREV